MSCFVENLAFDSSFDFEFEFVANFEIGFVDFAEIAVDFDFVDFVFDFDEIDVDFDFVQNQQNQNISYNIFNIFIY